MKVLHLNTLLDGGAAIAVKRIHQGLLNSSIDSTFFYKVGLSDAHTYKKWCYGKNVRLFQRIGDKLNILSWYQKLQLRSDRIHYLKGRPRGSESFSPVRSNKKIRFTDLPVKPDIVHLHWIAGFFDYREFFQSIPDNIPIVWTLHDMNPFTGGCHYSWDCDKYSGQCGSCHMLVNSNDNDLSRKIINDKTMLFSKRPIHIVAASHWIEEQARKSSLFANAASIRTIHCGLDIETFKPRDKEFCRQELGIGPGYKVIVFGADGVDNKRKGLDKLNEAINLLKAHVENIFLLTFGKNTDKLLLDSEFTMNVGHVDSVEMLSTIYSAADVFVMPSLYEAFGQVALEAMSCGVPVVSFDNGGVSDMVESGVTGMIAERGDVMDLSNKLLTILSNDAERKKMGVNARKLVIEKFTNSYQVQKYKKLYDEII